MARRTKDWNEGLAKDLKNPRFAREFLLASIDEDISLQHALGKVIRAMGEKSSPQKSAWRAPTCYEPSILAIIQPK
jgi:hypothetical protein